MFERVEAGELDVKAAATEIGLSLSHVHALRAAWRRGGADALRRRPPLPAGRRRGPDPRTVARREMEARLATEEGRALYRRRGVIIEPVFGRIKQNAGFRRFSRRGLAACASEWKLVAAAHNLMKLRRHRIVTAVASAG